VERALASCAPRSSTPSTSSKTPAFAGAGSVPSQETALPRPGCAKNTTQLYALFALANLVIVKKTLVAPLPA
jgi:hypothetical protein